MLHNHNHLLGGVIHDWYQFGRSKFVLLSCIDIPY
jgi:hypothetical protein